MKTSPAMGRYQEKLASIPVPGLGCHTALLGAANLGIIARMPAERIVEDLKAAIPRGSRRVSDREVKSAVLKAVSDSRLTLQKGKPWRDDKRPIDGKAALNRIIEQATITTEADLWEASPIRIDWAPEEDLTYCLMALYNSDDMLFIGERYEHGEPGRTICTTVEWVSHFAKGGKILPHFIVNPLDGEQAPQSSGEGTTFRGDRNVCAFRYCLAEFDSIPREAQIRFWSTIKLPLCALIDSGGKSIHALIDVQQIAAVDSLKAWTTEIKASLYRDVLIPLGVDPACANPARLSRLPGYRRGGRYQRLLWLAGREGRCIS